MHFWKGCRESLRLIIPTLKKAALPLISLHLASVLAYQYFDFAITTFMSRGREDLLFMSLIAGLQLLFSLLWSAAWVLVISSVASEQTSAEPSHPPLSRRFADHFNQLVIEQVRVLAGVIWRLPLLILPAVLFYIRMLLVPYIVIFDPSYQKGRVDALAESRQLSRGHLFLFSALLFASYLLPSLSEDLVFGEGSRSVMNNPLSVAIAAIVTFFIQVWLGIFLFSVARRFIRIEALRPEEQPSA